MRLIQLRVEDELHERLDDKRHDYRASWQSVGLALFCAWLEAFPSNVFGQEFARHLAELEPKVRIPVTFNREAENTPKVIPPKDLTVSRDIVVESVSESTQLHQALERIIASKHAIAIDAIARNLLAFDVLVARDPGGVREDFSLADALPPDIAKAFAVVMGDKGGSDAGREAANVRTGKRSHR